MFRLFRRNISVSLPLSHTYTHSLKQSVSCALLIAAFIPREKKRQNLDGEKFRRYNIKVSRGEGTNKDRASNKRGTLVTRRKRSQLRRVSNAFDRASLFLHFSLAASPPRAARRGAARARHGGNRIPRIRNYFESSRPTVGLTTRT